MYDEETELYYLRSRYYNPISGRFVSADAICTSNLFAYCANRVTALIDTSGRVGMPYGIDFEQGINKDAEKFPEIRAIRIGERAILSKGYIGIDITLENDEFKAITKKISMTKACDLVAAVACNRYEKQYGEPFILNPKCVSYEIEEHIYAYQWSIGDRIAPNAIALGFLWMKKTFDPAVVKKATEMIDIRESDVKKGGFQSQSTQFNYKDGLNSVYIGTDRDPWASER